MIEYRVMPPEENAEFVACLEEVLETSEVRKAHSAFEISVGPRFGSGDACDIMQ